MTGSRGKTQCRNCGGTKTGMSGGNIYCTECGHSDGGSLRIKKRDRDFTG